jgi:glycosyltransferase involved in cell wall biosynthesis
VSRSPHGGYRLRVLHVLNELQPSGAETMLRLAAGPWTQDGIELEVLSLGKELGQYAPELERAGFRTHHLPLLPVIAFIPKFLRLLRSGKFDVVHIHAERANMLLAVIARFTGRLGVVRTIHSVFRFEGRLRLERIVQRAILRWIGVVHVAVGESVRGVEASRFRNPTAVVQSTYDETKFQPPTAAQRMSARRSFGIADSEFVIAVVGNCSHVKNHRSLFEALDPSDTDVRVLHVGLEDEEKMMERALVSDLGLSSHVSFLGFVGDVAPVAHAADCYAMPSIYEGLGVAALEMLGSGVPALLADVPGIRDLKRYVPGIYWVEPTSDSLAVGLAQIRGVPLAERVHWSHETTARMRHHFGVEQHAAAYIALYRQAVKRL